jgi:PPOX class probable F420-dependent enzyme
MGLSKLDELPDWARTLLDSARVAHLGFIDTNNQPRVLPVSFALDSGCFYTAVDHKPKRSRTSELARVRYLRCNPKAALTVDVYAEDWTKLAWVQLLCQVQILDAPKLPTALQALKDKYPQYLAREPAGPLIEGMPERVLHWRASG